MFRQSACRVWVSYAGLQHPLQLAVRQLGEGSVLAAFRGQLAVSLSSEPPDGDRKPKLPCVS